MLSLRILIWILALLICNGYEVLAHCNRKNDVWSWECHDNDCIKVLASNSTNGQELDTCKLTCGENSTLLPKPNGIVTLGKYVSYFLLRDIRLDYIDCDGKDCSKDVMNLLKKAYHLFKATMSATFPHGEDFVNEDFENLHQDCNDRSVETQLVSITISLQTEVTKLTLDTDESYSLEIFENTEGINVYIQATTFFGARHAMETVSQLTAYSEVQNSLQIVNHVSIVEDKPAYKYRGLTLDISRNFYSIESLFRMVKALSYNKMNTLHLHITDTHSFPIEIKSVPQMSQYGAYSKHQTYSQHNIKRLVKFGLANGVRVLPEFDQPAHCGEGWQWGPSKGLGNLAVCVNQQPWESYCSEPPCGQLNPTNENLYDVLSKIYKEFFEMFEPDIFHAGGDEINLNCWNSSKEITDWLKLNYGGVNEAEFMKMWDMFLKESTERLYKANNNKQLPLILWTSDLTSPAYLTKYLDPNKYIIQLWTPSKNGDLAKVVTSGFRTIFSQYDTLYLDCGYGNWFSEGVNWCAPYKDWKLFYGNDPIKLLKSFNVNITDKIRESILGQEAAMWSETVDESTVDGKVWPRVSGLAERLWSNPAEDWTHVEARLIYHRDRLVQRGIRADPIQPLWCKQNGGSCAYNKGYEHKQAKP